MEKTKILNFFNNTHQILQGTESEIKNFKNIEYSKRRGVRIKSLKQITVIFVVL